MTKLLLISDSHRDKQTLSKIIKNEPNFDRVIFLGDGIEDVEDAFLTSSKPIVSVAGNCDTDYCISSERVIKVEDINIFITHGHFYDVKLTLKNVAKTAKSKTLQYYNYVKLSDVPADYDEMKVKGVGLTRSEFYGISRYNCCTDRKAGPLLFERCLEIVLSDE